MNKQTGIPRKLTKAVHNYIITNMPKQKQKRPNTERAYEPAGAWLGHGDGPDAGASHHPGDELLHLPLGAVVCDVGHDDVRVQGKPWPCAVHIGPANNKDMG